MEALGLRTLASSLQNSIEKESSLNLGKQRNKKVHGEGSDSSEYLPRAEGARKKKMKVSWWGVFTLCCSLYFVRLIFMQVLTIDLFTLLY